MEKLAILGASYLQAPLVKKAISMGIETHCFAWDNEDAVCKEISHYFYPISVLEKEAILNKCREIIIDGIITIATDICVPTISYVAENLNLRSNSIASGLLSTNKGRMREAFSKKGVASPMFRTITEHSELGSFKNFSYPLIVKPTDRSGSRGVSKVENQQELLNAVNSALEESFEKHVVVEEFFEGEEVSVESISWKGNHYILAITDKVTTGAPFFVEIEHHQPSLLPFETLERIKTETIKALNALEIEYGAGHSEFKINSAGEIKIIEVGARMGGDFIGSHLVELSTQYDYLKAVINVALNKFEIPTLEEEGFFSGVYFLSKETEYLLPFFETQNEFDIEKKVLKKELQCINNSNKRSGYLIYRNTKKVSLS